MFIKIQGDTNMNKQEKDILNTLYHQSVNNQREISELSGHSLGVVNKSIKELFYIIF